MSTKEKTDPKVIVAWNVRTMASTMRGTFYPIAASASKLSNRIMYDTLSGVLKPLCEGKKDRMNSGLVEKWYEHSDRTATEKNCLGLCHIAEELGFTITIEDGQ